MILYLNYYFTYIKKIYLRLKMRYSYSFLSYVNNIFAKNIIQLCETRDYNTV